MHTSFDALGISARLTCKSRWEFGRERFFLAGFAEYENLFCHTGKSAPFTLPITVDIAEVAQHHNPLVTADYIKPTAIPVIVGRRQL